MAERLFLAHLRGFGSREPRLGTAANTGGSRTCVSRNTSELRAGDSANPDEVTGSGNADEVSAGRFHGQLRRPECAGHENLPGQFPHSNSPKSVIFALFLFSK
jgi:hypothetical protein